MDILNALNWMQMAEKLIFPLFQEKKAAFSFCFLVGCDICRRLSTMFYLYKTKWNQHEKVRLTLTCDVLDQST